MKTDLNARTLLLATALVAASIVAPTAMGSTANGVPCKGDGDPLPGLGVRTGHLESGEVDDYNIFLGAGAFIVIAAEYVNNLLAPPAIHFASWINQENCTMRCEGGHVLVCQTIAAGWHTIGVHSHGPTGDYALAWAVL